MNQEPTPEQPTPPLPPQIKVLLKLATEWCEQQEQYILENGVPLTPQETGWAHQLGVVHPEKVRLLCVDKIPQPTNPLLRAASAQYGLLSSDTVGLSLRYGIFIRSAVWREKLTIVHEMVHTVQYERYGGIWPFLTQYLVECLTVGYDQSPMEREAIDQTRQILSIDEP